MWFGSSCRRCRCLRLTPGAGSLGTALHDRDDKPQTDLEVTIYPELRFPRDCRQNRLTYATAKIKLRNRHRTKTIRNFLSHNRATLHPCIGCRQFSSIFDRFRRFKRLYTWQKSSEFIRLDATNKGYVYYTSEKCMGFISLQWFIKV